MFVWLLQCSLFCLLLANKLLRLKIFILTRHLLTALFCWLGKHILQKFILVHCIQQTKDIKSFPAMTKLFLLATINWPRLHQAKLTSKLLLMKMSWFKMQWPFKLLQSALNLQPQQLHILLKDNRLWFLHQHKMVLLMVTLLISMAKALLLAMCLNIHLLITTNICNLQHQQLVFLLLTEIWQSKLKQPFQITQVRLQIPIFRSQ